MTFTEAAVEVLRLVGKPLHYKKITEVAIERNLLSHVGKTPEITMSSRLATMLKKDRGDAPIVKVKPGVFGLREFSADVLKAAEGESGHEYELPKDEAAPERRSSDSQENGQGNGDGSVEAAADGSQTAAAEKKKERKLPGADVFPEEEDDDVPILAKIEEDKKDRDGAKSADAEDGKRRKRRRRRRKKGEAEAADGGAEQTERRSKAKRGDGRRGATEDSRDRAVRGDWDRGPDEEQQVGRDLADAVASTLSGGGRQPTGYTQIAEALVQKGRLAGSAGALVPTVAAAVRGDIARARAEGMRARFRVVDGRVSLTDWALPGDAVRAEQDVVRSADRQRESVRRAFLRKVADLPSAGLMELVATWLNAEGVVSLRGVKRPGTAGNSFHLAGTLRRGYEETRLGIVLWRDGTHLGREQVIDVRGALHHYGNASAAWLITAGKMQSGAREEAAVGGTAPCVLFDGMALARAMERVGVGLRRIHVPVSTIDLDLLEGLTGEREAARKRESSSARQQPSGGRSPSRERDSTRPAPAADAAEQEPAAEKASEPASDAAEADAGGDDAEEARSGRRRRRRSRRGGRTREAAEGDAATAEPADAAAGEPAAPEGSASDAREVAGPGDTEEQPADAASDEAEPPAATDPEAEATDVKVDGQDAPAAAAGSRKKPDASETSGAAEAASDGSEAPAGATQPGGRRRSTRRLRSSQSSSKEPAPHEPAPSDDVAPQQRESSSQQSTSHEVASSADGPSAGVGATVDAAVAGASPSDGPQLQHAPIDDATSSTRPDAEASAEATDETEPSKASD